MVVLSRWARLAVIPAALAAAAFAFPAVAAEKVQLASVQSEDAVFRVVQVTDGLSHPWSLAFLPGGGILVTEREGRLLLLESGKLTPVTGLPEIRAGGQGGLLDLALHPRFAENRWLYFTYSAGRGAGLGTRVARGRLSGTRLTDVEVLYVMRPGSASAMHFGARLAFAADGTLLVSLGERNERNRAQDLRDPGGSVLRLTDDGRVPAGNPFPGRADALPEIWTWGHRNPQGLAVQPGTGLAWMVEHGPRGGDELNLLSPGSNYGWPVITYGREYSGAKVGEGLTAKPGLEQPVAYWVPSISPSGMAFSTGETFPGWKGNLFIGALSGKQLRRVVLDGTRVVRQEVLLQDTLGRIRDVRQGPDGNLWLLTDEDPGGLYRLEPAGAGS
jgi:glucose/arabinose dehydrogenase